MLGLRESLTVWVSGPSNRLSETGICLLITHPEHMPPSWRGHRHLPGPSRGHQVHVWDFGLLVTPWQ